MGLLACHRGARQDDCGFSEFNALEVPPESLAGESPWFDPRTHWAVKPVYPPEARAKRLTGTVHVRFLIDPDGHVIKTCPVYKATEAMPSDILVDAAMSAVKKGRFRPYFGLGAAARSSFRYAQSTIDINYTLAPDSAR
jgi:TonB family protein